MTAPTPSRDAAYFAALYDTNPDPWNFVGSTYEHRKYAATLDALGHRHFNHIFEIGCSIGVLTSLLAPQCDFLLAVDIAETALTAAKRRCMNLHHVTFANLHVPAQWPPQSKAKKFDLIILSEVLYFLNAPDIACLARRAAESLTDDGIILLVNYTEPVDEPCNGDQAADLFIAAASKNLQCAWHHRDEKFRIDRLEPHPLITPAPYRNESLP